MRCSLLLTLNLLVFSSPLAAGPQPPNIILILCDDLGHEGFSCYGSTSYQTPHLDELARTGIRFEHCYSQPICTPSRVEIMTGKYNFRNYERFGYLDPQEMTFANVLRDAGYATAIAGKWQLDGTPETVKQIGFDHHCLWQIGGRGSRYWDPVLVREGEPMTGLEGKFGPDIVNDYVLTFIDQHQEQPFLLYYPMMLPHWPFIPTPDSPPDGSRERSGKYDGQKGGVEYFDDMVSYLDKLIGKVVRKLDETGLRENTLILFTCDNGCATNIISRKGDEVIHGGKGSLPDAGTHVALIANWPGSISPGTTNMLVDFTDFLPTLAATAGAKIPEGVTLDGYSFLPQLLGKPGPQRKWVFCHYTRNGAPKKPKQPAQQEKQISRQRAQMQAKTMGRFARNQNFKLYDDGRFYHVTKDVLEQQEILPGTGSREVENIRTMLQQVLDGMPPWEYFRE